MAETTAPKTIVLAGPSKWRRSCVPNDVRAITMTDSDARAVLYALSIATSHPELWSPGLTEHRNRAVAAHKQIAREYAIQDAPPPARFVPSPPRARKPSTQKSQESAAFGQWLHGAMRDHKLTWRDVGDASGYSAGTIQTAAAGYSSGKLRAKVREVVEAIVAEERQHG